MYANSLEEAWQHWTIDNLNRGCDPRTLFTVLQQQGFETPTIKSFMADRTPANDALMPLTQPTIDYAAIANTRITRVAQVFETHDKFQLYTLDNFLNDDECNALIALIKPQLRPSTLTVASPDKTYRNSQTSDLVFINHPVVRALDEKIARMLGIRLPYSEGIQAQHYDVGQQFKRHTDYFQPGTKEYDHFAGAQGNRTWTFMIYLNDVAQGGGTHFFSIDHTFMPKRGMAVIWNNLRPDGSVNPYTSHAGMPVEAGQKIIVTKWFRELGDGGSMFYEHAAENRFQVLDARLNWRPQGDSNPCYRRERAVS